MRRAFCAALFLFCPMFAPAQAPESSGGTQAISLGVYEKKGRFVHGLKAEQIKLRGVKAKAVKIEPDRGPRRIILLIDTSRSMVGDGRGDDCWPYAVQMAKLFLSFQQPGDWLSLHVFAEKMQVVTPFTQDFPVVTRAIEALPRPTSKEANEMFGHYTKLGETLSNIVDKRLGDSLPGDTLVLISDGEVTDTGKVQTENMVKDLIRFGMRVIFIRIGPLRRVMGEEVTMNSPGESRRQGWALSSEMHDLAQDTGGFVLAPWDSALLGPTGHTMPLSGEVLEATARVAYSLVRNSYRVELELTEPLRKPAKLTVAIVDERGREMNTLEVMHPRFLMPPAVTTKP